MATGSGASAAITGCALDHGRRTVYINVSNRADASTLEVVQRVKRELPRMQSLIPDDIKIEFVFDQSVFVTNALRVLAVEGALGALLTGLMVWLFVRELPTAFIVFVTIPFSLLG